ncbi:MAG: acyl-CoA dehydratase activase [bacterium]
MSGVDDRGASGRRGVGVAIGVDAGSTTWKGVVIDAEGRILDSTVVPAEPLVEEQTRAELDQLRRHTGVSEDVPVGATGYGRKRVGGDRSITEITCHARGAFHRTGKAGLLVDMGGQDSKVIRIGPGGSVSDFAMNDKCAAGTGRFLEVLLGRLKVSWGEVVELIADAERAVPVSSTCTVFAESEVISLMAEGEPLPGILKGVHQSLASRVVALAGTLDESMPIYMSGGVALGSAMVDALSAAFGRKVQVLPEPQLVGALGAALSVSS